MQTTRVIADKTDCFRGVTDNLSSVDRKGLNYQDCEGPFHINRQSHDSSGVTSDSASTVLKTFSVTQQPHSADFSESREIPQVRSFDKDRRQAKFSSRCDCDTGRAAETCAEITLILFFSRRSHLTMKIGVDDAG